MATRARTVVWFDDLIRALLHHPAGRAVAGRLCAEVDRRAQRNDDAPSKLDTSTGMAKI
jgi:hypothetical protein